MRLCVCVGRGGREGGREGGSGRGEWLAVNEFAFDSGARGPTSFPGRLVCVQESVCVRAKAR